MISEIGRKNPREITEVKIAFQFKVIQGFIDMECVLGFFYFIFGTYQASWDPVSLNISSVLGMIGS